MRSMIRAACAAALLAGLVSARQPAQGRYNVDTLRPITLVEEVRIGSRDDPSVGFTSIGDVDVDRDGNVYVFERRDQEIRVYAPTGRFVRRFGRRGKGPGEFPGGPPSVVYMGVQGDTVWATQFGWRLILFNRAGRELSTHPIERVSVAKERNGLRVIAAPTAMTPDGLFDSSVDPSMGHPRLWDVTGPSVRVPDIRFNSRGEVVDTSRWYVLPIDRSEAPIISVGQSRYPLPLPPRGSFGTFTLVNGDIVLDSVPAAQAAERVVRLTRRDRRGATVYARTFVHRAVRYSAAMLDSAAARAARPVGPRLVEHSDGTTESINRFDRDSAAARIAIRRQMRWPEFQPAVPDVQFTRDNSLWLGREDLGGPTLRWIVLDAMGVPRGEVQTPRDNFRIVWTQGDVVWVVRTDDADIPWLIRYRLR